MKYLKTFTLSMAALVVSLIFVAPPARAVPSLNWQPCTDAPARDCATLSVPLNYANPSQGNINLPVARAKATDIANRLGPLFFNLGGPGVASLDTIKFGDLGQTFSPELVSRFDIIGFDPRGTTNGINCFASDNQGRAYWEANHLPQTTAEVTTILNLNRSVNQACLSNNIPLVKHVDTASTVRDMEQLRLAMNVQKFSYIGFSYGTFIGNRYAKLFPGHLRAMVLDAATDRGISDSQHFKENSIAFEQAWQQFKQWCQDATNDCRLRNENIDAVFDQLLAAARTNPIPAPLNPFGNRPVNDWELTISVQAVIGLGTVTFAWIDEIISKARTGDASLASLIYDSATGYNPETNTYTSGGTRRSIFCMDTAWSQNLRNTADVQALTSATEKIAPRFGKANVFQGPAQCFKYPVVPVEPPPVALTTNPNTPTLVVGATKDTSTPLIWAARMTSKISGSRLLVRDGDGHISLGKSRCVEAAVNNALVRLQLPDKGTVCPTDPDLYPPIPVPVLGPTNSATAADTLRNLKIAR